MDHAQGHQLPREKVAEGLRRRIKAGEWPKGEAIPAVTALADHYGCSTSTIHAAVRMLVDEGLLETRPRW